MISRRKALELMRQKDHRGRFIPFSIRFVKCSRSKKTGGELIEYNNVTLPQRQRVELDTQDRKVKRGTKAYPYKSTVTFRTDGGELKQAHVPLITRFNGEKIF